VRGSLQAFSQTERRINEFAAFVAAPLGIGVVAGGAGVGVPLLFGIASTLMIASGAVVLGIAVTGIVAGVYGLTKFIKRSEGSPSVVRMQVGNEVIKELNRFPTSNDRFEKEVVQRAMGIFGAVCRWH
jgi:hypothetical protein